jgi:hypothetical protein
MKEKIIDFVFNHIKQQTKEGCKKVFISPYLVQKELGFNVAQCYAVMLDIPYLIRSQSAHSFDSFKIDYDKFASQVK